MAALTKELVFWLALPALVAMGSAALVWLLMQARMQVLAAHYQAALARAEDSAARRPGLNELLAELHIERRRFLRKITGGRGCETTVFTLERLYFRNIPLTGWMQEEIPLGAGEELREETLIPQDFRGIPPEAGVVEFVPR